MTRQPPAFLPDKPQSADVARQVIVKGEIDIWVTRIDAGSSTEHMHRVTSAEERARASQFQRPLDRERFLTVRGSVRSILAKYVPAEPHALRFLLGRHGKPALAREPHWPDIRFNVSHSHAMALCAVTLEREIGVDIEWIDAASSDLAVAHQFFSESEVRELDALPERQRVRGFFNCWTRKEAYIKARGEGLSVPLGAFDVSLSPGAGAKLLCSRLDSNDPHRWTLRHLDVAEDYAAALAIHSEGEPTSLRLRTFPSNAPQSARSA